MKIAIKLLIAAIVLLFAAEPIVFAESGSPLNPLPDKNIIDISGVWTLDISNCKGDISISPGNDFLGASWNGIWTAQCSSDALRVQFQISEYSEAYHFIGSGSYNDGVVVTVKFDLGFLPYEKSLAGSGFFATGSMPKRSINALMHR